VINDAHRKPQVVLLLVKQGGAQVVDLKDAQGKAGRQAHVYATSHGDHPFRVAFTCAHPRKRSGTAKKKVGEEQLVASRIEELRSSRDVSKIQLRTVLSAQFRLNSKTADEVVGGRKIVAV